jgi:hypothetical protein
MAEVKYLECQKFGRRTGRDKQKENGINITPLTFFCIAQKKEH